jgi:hypothetical protein
MTSNFKDTEMLGTSELTVAEMITANQHRDDKNFLSPRNGRCKGTILPSLDIIIHMSSQEQVTIDLRLQIMLRTRT